MPVRIKHPEFPTRDFLWDANGVREPAGWSLREFQNLSVVYQMLGVKGSVRFRDYRDHGSFANMLSDLGGDITEEGVERYTVLIPDNVVIANDTTVRSNLTLIRIADGKFTIANGVTLTFETGSKFITEPDVFVFDVASGSTYIGNILASNAVDFFTPDMFGGGQTGLDLISLCVAAAPGSPVTANIRILKSFTVSGTVSVTADIEYIKPGVVITIADGASLTIAKMSSLHCHNPFTIVGSGLVSLGSHVRGPEVKNVHFKLATSAPDTADITSGYLAGYMFEMPDKSIQFRVRASAGTVYYVALTEV